MEEKKGVTFRKKKCEKIEKDICFLFNLFDKEKVIFYLVHLKLIKATFD